MNIFFINKNYEHTINKNNKIKKISLNFLLCNNFKTKNTAKTVPKQYTINKLLTLP